MQVEQLQIRPNQQPNLLKRSRSTSPGSSKRRVPADYSPSIYNQLPPHLTRALSTSSSGASSPHDWVSRTSELHLATPTPPGATPESEHGEDPDLQYSQEIDAMEADEEPPPRHLPPDSLALYHHHFQSLPVTPSIRTSPFESQHPTPPPPPPPSSPNAPHHPPDLFANLAGSPASLSLALSRSSSGSGCTDTSMQSENRTSPSPPDTRLPTSPQRRNGRAQSTASFSMGYRADCEKCVSRVPGHYSHIGCS
ncbi:hypothetical protein T439DRAFT_321037 [Meredithblackwellia eburnea MCA 4105]